MFCSKCGAHSQDGAHFCEKCGAPLQAPGGITYNAPPPSRGSRGKAQDPYKNQIDQLKLQIKQLKLDLKQLTTKMSSTRAQYNETSAFVPHGLLKHGYKMIEDARLLGPQQQKQRLQQEIMQLEQQLLGLQESQRQWKLQQ